MITLSFGFEKPQTGDKGSSFFPALEADIQQLNDHTHDGVNSHKLTALSFTGVSQDVTAVGWSATSGGTYRQTVTTPSNITFDDYGMEFIITNGSDIGARFYPTVVKITNTTYYVYTNDNTITFRVLYLA